MKDQNEKQAIEEMAKDIFDTRVAIDGIDIAFAAVHGADTENSHFVRIAKYLVIGKGYRKQSGWISVEERLPEPELPILIFTRKNRYYVGYYYKAVVDTTYTGFYADSVKRDVTHWMPLPEPPKMKGGD